MTAQEDRITASVILKCAVEYLSSTSPEGSQLEPGALRTTCSVIRNVYLATVEELSFIPSAAAPAAAAVAAPATAPVPAVAAARQVSEGVDFAGEGKFTNLPIQIREFDSKGQQTASNGTPYMRFVSTKGQWWTLWNVENIATAQAAGVCDQQGNGGWISCAGSVNGKFTNIQKAEMLPAGGAI